mmetsp:Transcript_37067/g.96066  ORF Transcript_37067/g.96066 Transcript_37067/m.96066 type:complete len:214 (-) Transcript_37067:8-649(-)
MLLDWGCNGLDQSACVHPPLLSIIRSEAPAHVDIAHAPPLARGEVGYVGCVNPLLHEELLVVTEHSPVGSLESSLADKGVGAHGDGFSDVVLPEMPLERGVASTVDEPLRLHANLGVLARLHLEAEGLEARRQFLVFIQIAHPAEEGGGVTAKWLLMHLFFSFEGVARHSESTGLSQLALVKGALLPVCLPHCIDEHETLFELGRFCRSHRHA